ncbi:MAG: zinc-ribbon domain-containing protein [Candidatus Fimivivens sp.]|nr:zinc-ribbon domain-containing protein [Candidatus Fimivivens sp.]
MLKVAFFEIPSMLFKPKFVKAMRNQKFLDYSPATDFIAEIGERNIISINYYCRGTAMPTCAITYRDDELLTCPECGKEISNAFNFCPHCGARLN